VLTKKVLFSEGEVNIYSFFSSSKEVATKVKFCHSAKLSLPLQTNCRSVPVFNNLKPVVEEPFSKWGAQANVKKLWKFFSLSDVL